MAGLRLTLPQRCLLYLLDRGDLREDDPAAQEATQDRIAESIGARRAHVSRAMGKLAKGGLLKTAKVHVEREARRRLAYFLTDAGLRRAQSVRKEVEEERIVVIDLEGNESQRRLYEIPLLLPRRPRLSDVLGSIGGGRLDLRTFLDRQTRMKGGKVYDVPEAVLPAHFQGRAAELLHVQAFLGEPHARGLVIVGLPGIGKTALASRAVTGLKGRRHVLWRRLHPETSAQDLLRDIGHLLEGAGRPALSEILRRPPEGREGLPLLVLKRDLAEASMLLVFDDVHSAGPETAALLGDLVHIDAPAGAIKVIVLSRERPGFVHADDSARDRVWELELDDLAGPDALAVLDALGTPASKRREILDRCGGHPLSLELAAAGRLTLERVRQTSATWFAEEALARLAVGPRRALELACVFEGTVPPEATGAQTRELVRRCLIREVEGGRSQVHDLIREAVLLTLSPTRLAALRSRVGRVLAQSRDPSDTVAAIRQFLLCRAFDAAKALALERGVEVIDAGLSQSFLPILHPNAWAKAGRRVPARISLLRGEALFALGRWTDAGQSFASCTSTRDPLTAAEARLGQGKAAQQRETLSAALPLLLDARERFEKLGALRLLAETQYRVGCVHEIRQQMGEAQDAYERGRAVAFDVGDRRWEGLCTYGLGRLRSLLKDNAAAVELEREALRLLERGGYRLDIAKVCAGLGGNLLELKQLAEAESYITRAITEARATGAIAVLAGSLYNLASIRVERGDLDGAIPPALEALEYDEILEHHGLAAWAAAWLAYCYWSRGEEELATRYFRIGDEHVKQVQEPALKMRALRHLGRAARLSKRLDEARVYLDRALSEAQRANLPRLVDEIVTDIRALPSP